MTKNQEAPNFTQVPNAILDNAHLFTGAEFTILMIICRQTYGWHKDTDKISLTQFQKKSNMSRQGVINTLRSLMGKNIIFVNKGNITEYGVVNSVDWLIDNLSDSGQLSRPELVNSVDTQNKINKESTKVDSQNKPSAKRASVSSSTRQDAQEFIDYFNLKTNKKIKLTDQRVRKFKATIKDHNLEDMKSAIDGLISDRWSIDNNQIEIDRLLDPGKRDKNIERFKSVKTYQDNGDFGYKPLPSPEELKRQGF